LELKAHHQGWAQQKPIPALQRECGPYGSPAGESIAPAAAVRTLAEGFDSFFLSLSCLPLAAAHPYVGSRQRRAGRKRWTGAHLPPYLWGAVPRIYPLTQQRPIKRLKQAFSQQLRAIQYRSILWKQTMRLRQKCGGALRKYERHLGLSTLQPAGSKRLQRIVKVFLAVRSGYLHPDARFAFGHHWIGKPHHIDTAHKHLLCHVLRC